MLGNQTSIRVHGFSIDYLLTLVGKIDVHMIQSLKGVTVSETIEELGSYSQHNFADLLKGKGWRSKLLNTSKIILQ
jgi:hypothetical protein